MTGDNLLEFYELGLHPKYWQTELAANSAVKYEIGTVLPSYVKTIIGLITPADGVNTQNTALPSHTNMLSLYLVLVKQEIIYDNLRLDIFHDDNISTLYGGEKFLPVNIKAKDIDLDRCYILNPSGLSVAITIGFLYL